MRLQMLPLITSLIHCVLAWLVFFVAIEPLFSSAFSQENISKWFHLILNRSKI